MPQLRTFFTTLDGDPLGKPSSFRDWQVEIPLSDSRTGKFTMSVYDKACRFVKPLRTVVQMWWGPHLVLNGPITVPAFNPDGTVEVNVHDATFWTKHHFSRYGDLTVDGTYGVEDQGFWLLMAEARASDFQLANGVRDLPLVEGRYQRAVAPDAGALRRKATRGSNIWESMTNLSKHMLGPDFDVVPTAPDVPYLDGSDTEQPWAAPLLARVDLYDQLMTDRSTIWPSDNPVAPVLLQAGFGLDNIEWPSFSPDGDSVRNGQVIVPPGGEKDADDARRGDFWDFDSQAAVGILEGWESSGNKSDTVDTLENKAELYVKLYKDPLPNLQVDLRPSAPRYPEDFYQGDVLRVQQRRGYAPIVDERARVMKVTLKQLKDTREGIEAVELNPYRAIALLGETDPTPGGGTGGGDT